MLTAVLSAELLAVKVYCCTAEMSCEVNFNGVCNSSFEEPSNQCNTTGATCIEDKCQCAGVDFLNQTSHSCDQKVNFNGVCNSSFEEPSNQCNTTGATCIADKCQCAGVDFLNQTSHSCDQKVNFNGVCNSSFEEPSNQCNTTGATCIEDKCQCAGVDFLNQTSHSCDQKVNFNGVCNSSFEEPSNQCNTTGATCIEDKCQCAGVDFLNQTSHSCDQKVNFNGVCNSSFEEPSNQCNTTGATCIEDKCQCAGVDFLNQTSHSCDQKVNFNGVCNSSFEEPSNQCNTTGATCIEDKCQCAGVDFLNQTSHSCDQKVNFNGVCNSSFEEPSNQCNTTGAKCIADKCQCASVDFFNQTSHSCDQKVNFNGVCNSSFEEPSNQCNTTGAKCIADKCQCASVDFLNQTSHSCDQKVNFNGVCNSSFEESSKQCNTTGATCTDSKCKCASGEFYNTSSDSCDQQIVYNGTCDDVTNTPSNQCETNQSFCINNTCQCNNGVYYDESKDSCEIRPTMNGTPIVYKVSTTQFRIRWNEMGLNSSFKMHINVYDENQDEAFTDMDYALKGCDVKALKPGTKYQIDYYITDINRGVPSITNAIYQYTAPETPPPPTIWERWENNLTLKWENINHNSEYYILTIDPAPSVGNTPVRIPGNDKLHNVTFDHLSGGILYTVTIKAIAGEINASTTSRNYTRPVSVTNATIRNQTNFSLDVNVVYSNGSSELTSFIVYIDPPLTIAACESCNNIDQQACNETFYCGASSRFTINNLQDGTLYNLSIYAVLDGLTSEEEYFMQEYTRPNGPSVPAIENITSAGFDVTYNGESSKFDMFTIKLCFENESVCQLNMSTKDTYFTATNLSAGTNYKVTVNTVLHNGLESLQPQSSSSFTRPNGPNSVNIPSGQIHENNVTIVYTTVNSFYDHIEVDLLSNDIEITVIKTYNTSILTGLRAATNYKINVCTATQTGLRSSDCLTETFTTRPSSPDSEEFVERSLNFITFNLSKNTGTFDHFDILDKDGTLYKILDSSSDRIFKAEGLVAGTLYEYKIYTNYSGLRSDSFLFIQTYTQPAEASGLNLTNRTQTSLTVMWDAPDVGIVTSYQWTVTSLGPNSGSQLKTFNDTTSMTSVDIDSLESGSVCKVTVTSQIIFNKDVITGNSIHIIDWCTYEQGPGKIESLSNAEATPTSLTIEWEKPSVRNGVIQSYEIVVFLKNNEEKRTTLNCTKCTILPDDDDLHAIVQRCSNASVCDNAISDKTITYNITGLHPFRTYKVTVVANTSIIGLIETSYYETEEAVPSGSPNFTDHSSTATEIQLNWNSPAYGDRNGIITTYYISYSYMDKTCTDDINRHTVTKYITLDDNSTSYTLTGLDPYTNHSIQIKASTKVGDGPFSEEIHILTQQSTPTKVRQLNSTRKSNESILLSWLIPCRPNGVITDYTIYINNTDNNAAWKISSNATSVNVTDKILPYRNYSINVIGNTVIGEGNMTDNIEVTTSIGIPRIPRVVTVKNVSSTEIKVAWESPELYTGPTKYEVSAIDQNKQNKHTKTTSGFNSTVINIDGLDKYWLYDITVTAMTSAGKTKTGVIRIRTAEDVPEKIRNLQITPESNVTKRRTINVQWEILNEMERNGVITHYVVQYTFEGNTSTESLNSNSSRYVIQDIKPGNYTIKVFASTSKGNGAFVLNYTTLGPGAPIKVPEKPGQPLIQISSVTVADAETQIAIELPVESFLCNTTNGEPVEWGVIVSEESVATDEPFFGSKSEYEKRKTHQYITWKNAKDKKPMPAYIATDPKTFDPCVPNGNRRRRSTTSTAPQTFTVGEDGECSGSQKYCNGKLPPNRNFRVKSYVCTEGGCTETNYGPSIKTAPDPTIPIAAGVTSAVVVIIVVVVLIVMKRKQLVCFQKKDVENTSTHVSGDGIEFDRLESKRSTTTRPFTPGQIKLADFPARVEVMHKDSDLIFADAYKMLKEQSPSHPLTAAEAQCSRPKNRYTNILPFDHSRVKLRPSDDVEGSDYINANYIPGYTSPREYIATQGPMMATFDDFWRMIWEQNVDTIVMLTKLVENGRHKCDKYWPDVSEPVYYGDLVVSVSSESNLSDYTIRIIEVKLKDDVKKVYQFCYLKWPDMGCPDTPDLLIDFVKNVRNYTKGERLAAKSPGPTVVHCSAGVGRTGTFIAVDTLLQHIRDHDEVDIFKLVKEMRNYRLNMVQTEDQYIYIHECLKAFISTDEDEEEEDHLYANTPPLSDEHVYENTAFNSA
ncbi:hypothetical protein ACF0H5_008193 [Mactra antiquata]